jgi:transposase
MKMKKPAFTIGVDVSKKTLDIHCIEVNKHLRIANESTGFKAFLKFCKDYKIDLSDALIVLEYTGGYEYRWIQFCASKSIPYVRIPGLAIKRSLGITRGKNDRVDASRIANYGDEKFKQLEPEKPINTSILQLKELLGFRKRVVRESAGYKASIQERNHMYEVPKSDIINKMLQKKLDANDATLLQIEEAIDELILTDQALLINYKLLTSIKGIGKVNAWMTIAYTENFTSFTCARSYAVYVGVIPFDHTSGTSIKGKRRVSKIANKELKQELSQAAKSAIIWNEEMKEYATRKLPNKPYGIVMNNVKFKLILRMFAVVKKGEKYVDNLKKAA